MWKYFGIYLGLLIGATERLQAQAATSLLSTGRWFRIAITEEGIYRVDAALLRQAGLDPRQINPTQLEVYGQPGGMLPQSLSDSYPQGLLPHAVYLQDNGNSSWEEEDMLLFYAESPDSYTYSPSTQQYQYQKNLYSDTLYYFLGLRGEQATRISEMSSPEGTPVATLEHFEAYYAYEQEKYNLLRSGRRWYGELFTSFSAEKRFDVPLDPVEGTSITLQSAATAGCYSNCAIEVRLQGQQIGTHSFASISPGSYERVAWHNLGTFTQQASAEPLSLQYNFTASNNSQAYLDYFFVQVTAALHYGSQEALFFRHRRALGGELLRYEVSTERVPFALWEISNSARPQQLPFQLQGHTLQFTYQYSEGKLPQFVLFSLSDTQRPHHIGPVANQNFDTNPALLIVTAPLLWHEAQRLAAFHRQHDGMQVQVISTLQLYNEVSAGRLDPTAIRNYAYRLHKRGSLKYVLLFGAASFDYKQILHKNPTHVPTYQSRASLDPLKTYASDDYFGFLEDSEGNWGEEPTEDHTMDIGIGRLPARSLKEATNIVNKIIHYATSPSTLGSWRQQMYFVADDGDFNLHHKDIEKLVAQVEENYPLFQIQKLYLDDFPQEQVAAEQISPKASEALERAIHKGALVINFSGHGNTSDWTAEKIFSQNRIRNWYNWDKLPLFITATCDFGKHDNPVSQSAGEELLFHETGGGIALLSTARPVQADANFLLNSALVDALFARDKKGNYLRLGDIQRHTKNNSLLGVGNRSFTLLGDPALRLSYPEHQVRITAVNDIPLANFTDTLQARSKVTLQGKVYNNSNQLLSDYEGKLQVVVYDKESTVRTLGDENLPFSYPRRVSLIFQGTVSVTQGRFSISYVIPQSISYKKGKGRMFFYLEPAQGNEPAKDGAGTIADLYIGGPAAKINEDPQGPYIEAFLDEQALVNGLRVGPRPQLRIRLSDPQGIKLSGIGPAKNLNLILDNEPPVSLAALYQADLDSYQDGEIQYTFAHLSDGRHTLRIQAWDNYDNPSQYSSYFFTSIHTPIVLSGVISYPNPTRGETFFSFAHNKGDHRLEVHLRVWNMEGRHMIEKSWLILGGTEKIIKLVCDLSPESLSNGLHIYQLDVIDREDGTKGHAVGKLIVRH